MKDIVKRGENRAWYVSFVLLLGVLQLGMFLLWGEDSYVAIHDNLDLFVAHNTMVRRQGIFFSPFTAQDVLAPMLHGVSRDLLGSEFFLTNILYALLPPFAAYVTAYCLKILLGFGGFLLLAKEVYGEKYATYRPLLWLAAAGFAIIPVFPQYGICFTSVPLLLWLLLRIYRQPRLCWYVLLFCYPLLSYFSYFGFFLLAYLVCGIVILWCRDKRLSLPLVGAVPVLTAGYVIFEYRLFREMFFGNQVTIRESMVVGDYPLTEILKFMGDAFTDPVFHAQDSHKYWVWPVCLVILLLSNLSYLRNRQWKSILTDPANGVLGLLLFNCIVYGVYYSRPVRDLVEFLLPPLTGFQFNRTIYFNPLLWYGLLFLCLKKVWDLGPEKQDGKLQKDEKYLAGEGKWYQNRLQQAACAVGVIAVLTVMLAPQVYNDFFSNGYHHIYKYLKGRTSTQVSFGEFYSEELFESIKKDIGYQGEWSAAYGMHPAILQFNGIATLDGYLGLYSEAYKQQFRQIIAPALERSEEFRENYDTWGARAYLYSGSGENTYQPLRELTLQDHNLYIDSDSFRGLGGTYIFSRIEIANARELELSLKGVYQTDSSPYVIYLYEVVS